MDPGNWATGLAGGSAFGYTLLGAVMVSNLMAILLQSLAARLGIAQPSLYHYFRTKEDLLSAALEREVAEQREQLAMSMSEGGLFFRVGLGEQQHHARAQPRHAYRQRGARGGEVLERLVAAGDPFVEHRRAEQADAVGQVVEDHAVAVAIGL